MDVNTKANLVEQASKLVAYTIRAIVLRPKKVVREQEAPTTPSLPSPQVPLLSQAVTPQLESQEGPAVEPSTEPATKEAVSTACLSCSRSHLSTVAGALSEALRFARGDPAGIKHPEVQRRIMLAEDEILMLERIDMSAESLIKTPPTERAIAEQYLPRIRQLRQNIGEISSLEQLEEAAADASILGQEFRLAALQAKGVDLNPVIELAKRVEAGEITMEEAKERVKEILPEEEEVG